MNVSTNGSNRSSYTHFENAFQPRLIMFRSEDGIHSDFNHHNRDARYEIEVKDVDCLPNQIITAYVHSANIPLTTYQFTNLNDTFFLYLPDWEGVKFNKDTLENRYGGLDAGVVPIILKRQNYTTTELKVEIQSKLDALTTTYKTEFDAVFAAAAAQDGNAQATIPTGFKCKILTADLDLTQTVMNTLGDQTTVQFAGLKTAMPVRDALYHHLKYKFNTTTTTTYVDPSGNTTRPSRVWLGVGYTGDTRSEVWVLSEPRFNVTIASNDRIVVERVDLLGHLPTNNTSEIHRYYLSSGQTNYHHLGLNRPRWGTGVGSVPSSSSFKVNTYNTTGRYDSTRLVGSIMTSHYQKEEYDAIKTTVDTQFRQKMFFPNIPVVNTLSTIDIRSTSIRANVRHKGKHSNVIAQIPVNVNAGGIINWFNQYPVRFNLNRGNISKVDITITDPQGQLLNFNGVSHDISILFETWNKVDIPLDRQKSITYNSQYARNSRDAQLGTRFEHMPSVNTVPRQIPRNNTTYQRQRPPPQAPTPSTIPGFSPSKSSAPQPNPRVQGA